MGLVAADALLERPLKRGKASEEEQAGLNWSRSVAWQTASTAPLGIELLNTLPHFSLDATQGCEFQYKSWFEAYSRGELPGAILTPVSLRDLNSIAIPIARYISTLAHIGKDWEQQSDQWHNAWAQAPLPAIGLIGSGLVVRVVCHGVIDQVKRLGTATHPSVITKLLTQHIVRILPAHQGGAKTLQLSGNSGPALDRIASLLPAESAQVSSIGPKPAERAEWHQLSLQILRASAPRQQKKLAEELVGLARQQGLLFSGESDTPALANELLVAVKTSEAIPAMDEQAVLSTRLLLGYATENDMPQATLEKLCKQLRN